MATMTCSYERDQAFGGAQLTQLIKVPRISADEAEARNAQGIRLRIIKTACFGPFHRPDVCKKLCVLQFFFTS
jgi:hypothetical protein